jgi:steroid delta-isomerase-like uncharacterized protein
LNHRNPSILRRERGSILTSSEGEARAAVEAANVAFNAHDWDLLMSLHEEGFVLRSAGLDGPITGREAYRAYLVGIAKAFPDIWIRIARLFHQADWVCEEFVVSATHKGPFALPNGTTLRATRKKLRIEGCALVRVAHGKIVEIHQYFDFSTFLSQLGLAP